MVDTSDGSANSVIAALGAAIGIPGLVADGNGCCRLLFDASRLVEIRCTPPQERWVLACTLKDMHLDATALQVLMRGNHMGAGFGGGWVGTNEQDRVVLHLPVPMTQASPVILLQAIELLLNHADCWERRLTETVSVRAGMRQLNWA